MRKLAVTPAVIPAAFILAMVVFATSAVAQTVTQFPISPHDIFTPTKIAAGPDGALWFTDLNSSNIGRLTTAGVLTLVSVPHGVRSSTFGITAAADGTLWFTEYLNGQIGRLTSGGVLTEFDLPSSPSFPRVIVEGPDGALWFTESFGNRIGRITTAGVIREFPIPTAESFPGGITKGPDGALWFTELDPGANKIGRITTSGLIQEFPIPTAGAYPSEISSGPDGNLWFTETNGKAIGRITTSGVITEFAIPAPISRPVGITSGPDGNLWFTDNAGAIGRISTAGRIDEFPLLGGDDYDSGITLGPDGALWFTYRDSIGRITTGSCPLDPASLCLNGGRFRVQADWRVPSQGTSGHGAAISLTADTGYFWFFSPGNVEMVVKVVDGCAFNNRHWVFAGGLTNVEVALTVTDTETGAVRIYVNFAGTAFQPVQDTAAFAGCP